MKVEYFYFLRIFVEVFLLVGEQIEEISDDDDEAACKEAEFNSISKFWCSSCKVCKPADLITILTCRLLCI